MSWHHGRGAISPGVRLAFVAIAITLSSSNVPTQSAASYGVRDLGTLGGASAAMFAINEYGGVMVGQAQTASGANHAFEQGRSGPVDLGTLGGAESTAFTFGWDAIAGSSQTASGQEHAFSYGLFPATG